MTAVVQSAAGGIGNGSSTATLGGAPTAGNLLLFAVSYWSTQSVPTITGATLVSSGGSPSDAGLAIFTRIVVGGDGTGWQATTTDYLSVAVVELSDVNASTPVSNTLTFTQSASAVSSLAAPSVTPVTADIGGMAISVLALNEVRVATVPAGWTRIVLANTGGVQFHSTDVARLDGTIPNTSAISGAGWTWSGTSAAAATSVIVRPAGAGLMFLSPLRSGL